MPSPLLASSRRCTSPPLTKSSSLPSSTLRKPLIMCQGRSCGGPWGAWVWINWLCMSSRACTPMPGVVCGLMVNTVKSLGWELLCIRAPSLAHCTSSWCWKRYHISSASVCHGSFSILMIACSSQTPTRKISPSSRYGRLYWKVKGSVSTWRRTSSWSLVLALMSK